MVAVLGSAVCGLVLLYIYIYFWRKWELVDKVWVCSHTNFFIIKKDGIIRLEEIGVGGQGVSLFLMSCVRNRLRFARCVFVRV